MQIKQSGLAIRRLSLQLLSLKFVGGGTRLILSRYFLQSLNGRPWTLFVKRNLSLHSKLAFYERLLI